MGIYNHKPKRLETVDLPAGLVAFLADVSAKIDRGEPEAIIESDDLLQCDGAYGGRIEENGDEWGFTYIVGTSNSKWELVFTAAELRAIADGSLRQIPLHACVDLACGNKFSWREHGCPKCDRRAEHFQRRPGNT